MTPALEAEVLAGGYWLVEPSVDAEIAIAACGPVLPEALRALDAHRRGLARGRPAGRDLGRSVVQGLAAVLPRGTTDEPCRQACWGGCRAGPGW